MIVACEHSLFCGGVQCETNARNPSVFALHVCMRKLTLFTLCCYVIGLFKSAQTNHKRKGMWFGCKQSFLWREHHMTSQKMVAEETIHVVVYHGISHLSSEKKKVSCGIFHLKALHLLVSIILQHTFASLNLDQNIILTI